MESGRVVSAKQIPAVHVGVRPAVLLIHWNLSLAMGIRIAPRDPGRGRQPSITARCGRGVYALSYDDRLLGIDRRFCDVVGAYLDPEPPRPAP